MLSELSHLQEVVDVLHKHTADPHILPPASEQVRIPVVSAFKYQPNDTVFRIFKFFFSWDQRINCKNLN